MKIEKLILKEASDFTMNDIADMVEIRYHPTVAGVHVIDDLHAEVSAADDWMEMVHMDIELFCPAVIFESAGK